MSEGTVSIWISILAALGVLLREIFQYLDKRKQTASQERVDESSATERITGAASKLVDDLQAELTLLRPLVPRMAQLENEVHELRESNERLIRWSEKLVGQLVENGIEPAPFRIEPISNRFKFIRTEKKKSDDPAGPLSQE